MFSNQADLARENHRAFMVEVEQGRDARRATAALRLQERAARLNRRAERAAARAARATALCLSARTATRPTLEPWPPVRCAAREPTPSPRR